MGDAVQTRERDDLVRRRRGGLEGENEKKGNTEKSQRLGGEDFISRPWKPCVFLLLVPTPVEISVLRDC